VEKGIGEGGLKFVETFDDNGYAVDWYKITKQAWQNTVSNKTYRQ